MNITNPQQNNRVVAYIRKSSEDNQQGGANKQLNSLKYQRDFVYEAMDRHKLKLIGKIYEDDKTGYEAYVRDGFNQMTTYLEEHKGEIDGIICTEISRLARNFADGGLILWYLQNGTINNIYTPTKVFTNSSSDQLMVAIEIAMSKKSSDEGSYRTKAGMTSKAINMKHPSRRPILGYKTIGIRGRKEWVVDPKTGPLVKQVFEQYATGKFTFEEIAEYAYQIGLRSNSSMSTTGKLTKNTWQNRLKDIQYTGVFEHGGERIAGEYEPLISSGLFYGVQEVMSGRQYTKETLVEYAYTSLVKCGLCGGTLSGTNKKGITYYRCSKRKLPCKETKRITYVPEDKLEDDILNTLETIEINKETWKAARKYVDESNQPQRLKLNKQIRELGGKLKAEETIQINIGRKYSSEGLPKNEYNRLMGDSRSKEVSLRNTMIKCENFTYELNQIMDQFLDNIKYVTKRLRMALPHNKREIIDIFCENLVWKDEKLRWTWKKPYTILAKQPKNSTMLPSHQLTRTTFGI